jgi:hypothetical protein
MAPKKILAAVPDEKMLPEAVVLSETGHSTVEFPLAQLDPKRSHGARSEVRQWPNSVGLLSGEGQVKAGAAGRAPTRMDRVFGNCAATSLSATAVDAVP